MPANEHTVIKKMAEIFQAKQKKQSVTGTSTVSGAPRPTTVRNVMTSIGDIIRGGRGGGPVRVPIGTEGQVLTVVDHAGDLWPEWQTAGTVLPDTAAEGDILYYDGATWQDLAIGTEGDVLVVSQVTPGHFQPRWSSLSEAFDPLVDEDGNIITDEDGNIVYAG